ncbi:hypothetical protein [Motiliproteus coralliicola]|uniref:hypothetical protein n=1 Tax=Motiliproteus coralliicola TaxID=2283196 RepID=UPI001058DE2E|nr:hypothetical protein [Motiliproteus coralliicola]
MKKDLLDPQVFMESSDLNINTGVPEFSGGGGGPAPNYISDDLPSTTQETPSKSASPSHSKQLDAKKPLTAAQRQAKSNTILDRLCNHEVMINVYLEKDSGEVSYLASKIAGANKKVIFLQDHISYLNITTNNKGKPQKIGILLRIKAEITTNDKDVNLGSLFAIGAAASSNSIDGKLSIIVYGLSGKAILESIPAPGDFSENSLMNALTCIATIKSKIYEKGVYINPTLIPDFN